jgi:hypothetical protein
MKHFRLFIIAGISLSLLGTRDADGRGFGGGSASVSRESSGSYSTANHGSGSYEASSSHSYNAYSGEHGGAGATSSYDHSATGSHGATYSTEGQRGVAEGPHGTTAAGGTRSTTATGPDGRSYSGSEQRGAVAGPNGGYAAEGSRSATATGAHGTVSGSSAYAGRGMSTDMGMAHYSSINTAATGHVTAYRSPTAVGVQGNAVRAGFGYSNCFNPAWNTAHPGTWTAAAWPVGAAYAPATWAAVSAACAIPAAPINYDYGNAVVYQDNSVYVNGSDAGSAQQYTQQATTLATQGQQAAAAPEQTWTPLGVFALVQGDEKISNNVFQIAVDKDGTLRGNYYDGLMDTTTPIFGSVDKKTQRAAWTIGKATKRVFDAGIFNLTKSETPVLVHIGADQTQQMLLVRVEQPKNSP